jgi:hypothetical protein
VSNAPWALYSTIGLDLKRWYWNAVSFIVNVTCIPGVHLLRAWLDDDTNLSRPCNN